MAHTLLFRRLILALQQARRENLQADNKPLPVTRSQSGWSRRKFLKTTALAGALPLLPRQAIAVRTNTSPKVAVVGAGIAGLNAAYQLQKAGVSVTVYEARPRVGGRIRSETGAIAEGLVTDLGAELINSDHVDMLALVEEFGLTLVNRVEDAQGIPFPQAAFLFAGQSYSEAEVANDLRAIAAQIGADAAKLDQDYERFAPRLDRLSVTDYLDLHASKIPQPYIRTLLDASIRTEYGVEPAESSALQLIFNLPVVNGQEVEVLGESDEAFVVSGGTSKIIEKLAQALEGQIKTRRELTRLEALRTGFRLHFASGQTAEADFVIVTIPFPILHEVQLDVRLPQRLQRFIAEVGLGRNEKILAGFSERAWRQEQGFVREIWTDLGIDEAWDESQRQPERSDGALIFYFGGTNADAIQSGTARSQGREFVERLDRFVPGLKDAATDRFLRTNWAQERFSRGAYSNYTPGQLTKFWDYFWIESDDPDERQEVHVGNLLFAGEHLSDAHYGFMNGAAETGRLAAAFVVRTLSDSGVVAKEENAKARQRVLA
jgi:monoamine oxidase